MPEARRRAQSGLQLASGDYYRRGRYLRPGSIMENIRDLHHQNVLEGHPRQGWSRSGRNQFNSSPSTGFSDLAMSRK